MEPSPLRPNLQRAKNTLLVFYIYLGYIPLAIVSLLLNNYGLDNGLYFEDSAATDQFLYVYFPYLVGLGELLLMIVAAVVFIMWFRRAYANLERIGFNTYFTDGWASGSWFVPIVNLGRPFRIMNEIWEETQTETARLLNKPYLENQRSNDLVGWWWFFWIVGLVGNRVSYYYARRVTTVEDLIESNQIDILVHLIHLIPLVLIILIIRRVISFEQDLEAAWEINRIEGVGEEGQETA